MKRKILTILCAAVAAVLGAFVFIACGHGNTEGGSGEDSGNNDVAVIGTYYLDCNGKPDDSLYYVFRNNKWTDADDLTGRYAVKGNKVTLYIEVFGEDEVYDSGIVSGDDITMSDGLVFRKGEDLTSKPKRLSYELSDDETYYKVTGIGTMDGDVVVPETYRTLPVTEIDYRAFERCTKLTSIEIPESVTVLGVQAFENCTNLVTAKINGKITELPEAVFGGCAKLVDLYIPSTVEEINYKAFVGCEKVQNVYYNGTVSDWAQIKFGISASHVGNGREEPYWANPISGSGRRLIINESTVTSCELQNVSDGAFFQYKYLTSVVAKEVGDYAFYYSSITSLSSSTVGKSACEGCHELKSFSGGGTKIGQNAFYDCIAMTAVSLGKSIIEIGESAFSYCDRLTSIAIPSSVIYIGRYAFSGNDMEEITFDTATDWAIDKDGELQEISQDLENKVIAARLLTQSENNNGYSGYDWKIEPIKYTLNQDNNSYCFAVTRAFLDTAIDIPETYNNMPITSIADKAFSGCKNLIKVSIPNSVMSIGSSVFSGCSSLTSITVAADNPEYSSQDGILYNKSRTKFVCIPEAIKGDITIPNGITHIGRFAFISRHITSIVIPNSVTSIGDYAFIDCRSLTSVYYNGDIVQWCETSFSDFSANPLCNGANLYINNELITNLEMPNTITEIKNYAFGGCRSLTSIEIPNSVTSIGEFAFYGCSSLTSIEMSNSVTSIGDSAFYGCSSLTSIEMSNSVTSIGGSAFYGCSSLTSIEMSNSVTSIGDSAFYGCSSLTIYCQVEGKQVGWSSVWNKSYCPVIWDCTNNDKDENGYAYTVVNGLRYCINNGFATLVRQPSNISGAITIPSSIVYKNATYSVTSIGSYVFENRKSLTSIEIPNSVTSIGDSAFYGCSSLTIYCQVEGKQVGWSSVWNNSYCPVIWDCTNNDKDEDGYAYTVVNGLRYCINNGFATLVGQPSNISGAITIPSSIVYKNATYSVTSIGYRAFYGCSSLTSIEIPNSVTSIERGAFFDCRSLTSIEIPNSVTSIGEFAFYGCSSFHIVFLGTEKQWDAISKDSSWAVFVDIISITFTEDE